MAFFDYPDVFKDFYTHYGVDQKSFARRWAATGNHAFVSPLIPPGDEKALLGCHGGRGRKESQRWRQYYAPERKETARRIEWLVLSLFPKFDV